MKKLLELKHWQLFVLVFVGPTLIGTIYIFNFFRLIASANEYNYMAPDELFDQMFSGMSWMIGGSMLFTFILYAWMWAIGHTLHPMLPRGVRMNLGLFKASIIIMVVMSILLVFLLQYYFQFIIHTMEDIDSGEGPPPGFFIIFLMFPIQIIMLICNVYCFWFCAKSIKTVEMQRETGIGDFLAEIFLMWFNIVGIWFLQPRLNRIVSNRPPPLPYDPVDHLIS